MVHTDPSLREARAPVSHASLHCCLMQVASDTGSNRTRCLFIMQATENSIIFRVLYICYVYVLRDVLQKHNAHEVYMKIRFRNRQVVMTLPGFLSWGSVSQEQIYERKCVAFYIILDHQVYFSQRWTSVRPLYGNKSPQKYCIYNI